MSRYEKYFYLLFDFLALNISFLIGFFLRFGNLNKLQYTEYQLLFVFANLIWAVVFLATSDRLINRRLTTGKVLWNFSRSWLINVVLVLALVTIIKGHLYSRLFIFYDYMIFLVIGGAVRVAVQLPAESIPDDGIQLQTIRRARCQ